MDFSFLGIVFRSEGKNSDMWHFIQVLSTEIIYNKVIVGDWAQLFLGESNLDHTCGLERGLKGIPQYEISYL